MLQPARCTPGRAQGVSPVPCSAPDPAADGADADGAPCAAQAVEPPPPTPSLELINAQLEQANEALRVEIAVLKAKEEAIRAAPAAQPAQVP